MMRLTGATVAVAALSLAFAGIAAAQDKVTELRYTTGAPEQTPWVNPQVQRFQKWRTSRGSPLKINAFLNSQLGSEQDTVQQVARGRIDTGGYSRRRLAAGAGDLAAQHSLPVPRPEGAGLRLRQPPHQADPDMFLKKGVMMLGWSEVGVADIIGKKPYLTPTTSRASRRARRPTRSRPSCGPVRRQAQSLPGDGVELGLPDRPHRCRRLRATSIFSGPLQARPCRHHDEHNDEGGVVLVNKEAYDKLSADDKAVLTGTSTHAGCRRARGGARLRRQDPRDAQKAGGTIVELTPEQRAVWRKGMEAAWPKMVEAVGGEAGTYWKAIQAAPPACSGLKRPFISECAARPAPPAAAARVLAAGTRSNAGSPSLPSASSPAFWCSTSSAASSSARCCASSVSIPGHRHLRLPEALGVRAGDRQLRRHRHRHGHRQPHRAALRLRLGAAALGPRIDRLADVLTGFFLIGVAWFGFKFVGSSFKTDLRAPVLDWPVWPMQLAIPSGSCLRQGATCSMPLWPALKPLPPEFQE